jgi:iron complex outermembrane recepter protein
MRLSPRVVALRLVLCALTLGAARPAPAQQREAPAADSARWTLPPVTVLATREARALVDVPLAITRLVRRDLFGASGYGLDEALGLVPGVVAQSRYGGSDVRIVIRGFGARGAGDRSNAGTTRGIRVLLDGVPETEPDGRTSFDNVDLASVTAIEVIRSNASSLWGNAAGGVVSLSTLDETGPRFASLERQTGGFGLARTVLRAGAPLGQGAIAASLANTEFDGWRQHSTASRWLGTLSAATTVGGRTRLGLFAVVTRNAFRIPGPLTQAQVDSAPRQANATYLGRDERRDNRLARLAVTLDHRVGADHAISALLFAGPKYLQRSERGTYRDFTRYHVGGNVVWRSRVRLSRSLGGTVLAGVDEARQDGAILFYSLTPEGTRGATLRDNKREGANNLGAFAKAEVSAGDHLGVTLGARYDRIAYANDSYIAPALDARRTFARVTPKLGALWRFSPRHSVYASLGGGVEAPAGNETDPASTFGQDTVTAINPLLEPIRSTTVEVGTKHVLAVAGNGLLRAVSYDVALYRTDVTNEIVPYRGGRFYFTAGKARRTGAELGVTAYALEGLRLQAALTASRNTYVTYVVDSVHYGRPGEVADYSGNRIVGVPDLLYSGSASYTLPGPVPLTARLGLQGMSRYDVDDANAVSVAGYATVTLTVGFEEPLALGAGLGLRGFVAVENLFDRRYVASAFLNPDVVGGVPVAFEPGLPRRLVVSLSLGMR